MNLNLFLIFVFFISRNISASRHLNVRDRFPESAIFVNSSVGGETHIALCECEESDGYPNGLGCDKEGWFISNFENKGTWTSGGGLVPLSHAICCRPCLPTELPETQKGGDPEGLNPIAIVSIGCHASTGRANKALMCENPGGSFITGFSNSARASSSYDVYYPMGEAECCTPAILLSTGDVWELKRCNCADSSTKDCGGVSTHRLLWGFEQYRMARSGLYIPVAPLSCCGLCLGDRIHDANNCEDLGFCNKNGICSLGSCSCFEGFGGADCSVHTNEEEEGEGMPLWATIMIISSAMLLSAFAALSVRAYHGVANNSGNGSGHGSDSAIPLLGESLAMIDEEGSAGSADTDDEALLPAEPVPAPCGPPLAPRHEEEGIHMGSTQSGSDVIFLMDDMSGGLSSPRTQMHQLGLVSANSRDLFASREASCDSYLVVPTVPEEPDAEDSATAYEAEGSQALSSTPWVQATLPANLGTRQGSMYTAIVMQGPAGSVQSLPGSAWELSPPIPVMNAPIGGQSALPVQLGQVGRSVQAVAAAAAAAAAADNAAALGTVLPSASVLSRVCGPVHEEDNESARGMKDHVVSTGPFLKPPKRSLAAGICAICIERPIQVALVPCGHANVCRRCSRRLSRCPFCRKEIYRRQRLFYSG